MNAVVLRAGEVEKLRRCLSRAKSHLGEDRRDECKAAINVALQLIRIGEKRFANMVLAPENNQYGPGHTQSLRSLGEGEEKEE